MTGEEFTKMFIEALVSGNDSEVERLCNIVPYLGYASIRKYAALAVEELCKFDISKTAAREYLMQWEMIILCHTREQRVAVTIEKAFNARTQSSETLTSL